MKTMAIRVEDELHAQYVILAQLDGVPLTEELRLALEAHVAGRRSEEGFAEKARAVLEEIDREAAARRTAISALFAEAGTGAPATEEAAPAGETPRRGRGRSRSE